MPSTSGCRSSSCRSPAAAAGAGEVTLGHQRRRRGAPGLAQGLAPAGEPVGAGCHVGRTGDGGDRSAAAADQVGARTASPAHVVGVDEADGRRVRSVPGVPGDDARDAGGDEPAGQRVVTTGRKQQHAVGVAPQQVALDARPVRLVLDHQQHQLVAGAGQRGGDAPDRAGEEGVAEQAGARLRDHEGDGVAAVGRQAPSRTVGRVAELLDRALDSRAGAVRHAGAAVDDPRHGRPRDAGAGGHVLQRAPGGGRPASAGHAPGRPLAAMTSRNHRALALGVRRWVAKSTCTMPKRWRVALGPLEVVEQRPHEEPAQVDAGGDGVVARPACGRRGRPGGPGRAPGRRRPARPRTRPRSRGRTAAAGRSRWPPAPTRRTGRRARPPSRWTSVCAQGRRRRRPGTPATATAGPRPRARGARGSGGSSSGRARRWGGRSGPGHRPGCGRDRSPAPGPRARRRGRPPAAPRRTTAGWRCRRCAARRRGRRRWSPASRWRQPPDRG